MFSSTGQRTCIIFILTLQPAQSQMIFCGSAVFSVCACYDTCSNFQQNYSVLTNFGSCLRTLVQVTYWSKFLIFVSLFLLLSPHSHITRKKKKEAIQLIFSIRHYSDHTSLTLLPAPFFSASFFKGSPFLPSH